MPTLTVNKFSCLDHIEFELAPVTIIIGPQGSGKSVTTKLYYFFADIISQHYSYAERGFSEEQFKKKLAKDFVQWFPPSAWGGDRFNISFVAGDFSARVLRRRSGGQLADEVTVSFSDWFSTQYASSKKAFETAREINLEDESEVYRRSIETSYRVQEDLQSSIKKKISDEYIESQTFIPAGRAFFTSLGRFVASFEGGGYLDPVTLRFAKFYASLRDRNSIMSLSMQTGASEQATKRQSAFVNKVFGGEITRESDQEFVETNDGRKIPFSALSSGQQELLPMWSILDYFTKMDQLRNRAIRKSRVRSDLIYIEEPEAHLFPSAQSILMEFLIGSIVSSSEERNLIITTHSPYIMSKINVFLKAGQISRRKKVNKKIDEIVPRECWLDEKDVGAFAIEDGLLINILDEDDGLIDASYLDQISEDISREYSHLLALEAEI